MTAFNRGDVVLVEFVFSDESGAKLRPALVVSTTAYHQVRQEVIVAAITSHVIRNPHAPFRYG
jgi:mRNA interferase MazF